MNRVFTLGCRAFGPIDVETDEVGTIIAAPVIVRRFLHRPIERLESWMMRLGDFTVKAAAQGNLFDAIKITDRAGNVRA